MVDNFLTPGDFIATGGAASATPNSGDITSYIRDLYANPAANGFTPGTSYLVLRLNPDADTIPTSGTQRYTTAFQGTASNGGAGTPENRPMITIETTPVPEPSAAGLLLVCALGLLCRRRSA